MKRLLPVLLVLGVLIIGSFLLKSNEAPPPVTPEESSPLALAPLETPTALPKNLNEGTEVLKNTQAKKEKLKPLDLRQIEDLIDDGKLDEAIRLLRSDLEQDPTDITRINELGRLLLEVYGGEQEALKLFQKALGLEPENQMAVEGVLSVYYKSKDQKGATAALQGLANRYPESGAISQALAQNLLDQGRSAEAIPYFEKSLSKGDQKNKGYVVTELADAYSQTGQWDKAIEAQKKVISAREKELADSNEPKEKIALMERSILTQRLNLADYLIESGKLSEAESLLTELSNKYPGDTDVASTLRYLNKHKL